MIDEEGYVHIMSRSDDIINVAAHRLSTGNTSQTIIHAIGSIEEILASHLSVAECCVVGMPDSQKGTFNKSLHSRRSRSISIHHDNTHYALP